MNQTIDILLLILLLMIGALIGTTIQWYLNLLDKRYILKHAPKLQEISEFKQAVIDEVVEAVSEDMDNLTYCAGKVLLESYLGAGCHSCRYYSDTETCEKHQNQNWQDLDILCKDWEHLELSKEPCYDQIVKLVDELKELGYEKFEYKYFGDDEVE